MPNTGYACRPTRTIAALVTGCALLIGLLCGQPATANETRDAEKRVQALVEKLGDPNVHVREQAAEELGAIRRDIWDADVLKKAVQPLIVAMRDRDVRVRSMAAWAMGELTWAIKESDALAPAVMPLARLLQDRDPNTVRQASGALNTVMRFVDDEDELRPVVWRIVERLDDPQSGVRANAARALSCAGKCITDAATLEPAVAPLAEAIDDPDIGVRWMTLYALMNVLPRIESPATVAPVIPALVKALDAPDENVGKYARYALGAITIKGGEIWQPLADVVMVGLREGTDSETRLKALDHLSLLVPKSQDEGLLKPIVPLVIAVMSDEDPAVRSAAFVPLYRLDRYIQDKSVFKAALQKVVAALSDEATFESAAGETVEVRTRAAWPFGIEARTGTDRALLARALGPLCDLVEHDDPGARRSALRGLSMLSRVLEPGEWRSAAPIVVKAVRDEEGWQKHSAIETAGVMLGMLDDAELAREALSTLVDALQDETTLASHTTPPVQICTRAAGTIEYLTLELSDSGPFRDTVPGLTAALMSDNMYLCRSAAWALDRVAARIPDAELLGPSLDPLLSLLQHQDHKTRWAAGFTLNRFAKVLGDSVDWSSTVTGLIEALRDPNPEIRWISAKVLKEIAQRSPDTPALPSAIGPLAGALDDPDAKVRWAAAYALQAIALGLEDSSLFERATVPLWQAVKDPDVRVQRGAVHCLTAIGDPGAMAAVSEYRRRHASGDTPVIAESTFEAGDDGWSGHQMATAHAPTDGNPGGNLQATEEPGQGDSSLVAPAKFLGDVSCAYGGTLDFDFLSTFPVDGYYTEDVRLEGAGMELVYRLPCRPGTDWTSYSVPMHESAGWRKLIPGVAYPFIYSDTPPASRSELKAVLSDLDSLWIRGCSVIWGNPILRLDNVVLNAGKAAD